MWVALAGAAFVLAGLRVWTKKKPIRRTLRERIAAGEGLWKD